MQTIKINNTHDDITYYVNFDEISMISFFLRKAQGSDTNVFSTVYIDLKTKNAEKPTIIAKTYESEEEAKTALHELKKKYENICDVFNNSQHAAMRTIML